jgi:hypothetical protein
MEHLNNMLNKKVKKIYIHAGMHKTATSSIQEALYANVEFLAQVKDGYFYSRTLEKNNGLALYSMFAKMPNLHHVHMQAYRTPNDVKNYLENKVDHLFRELKKTKCANLIFSGEDLIWLKQNEIKKMKAFFDETFPNAQIYILMYVRESVAYCTSIVQQSCKSGCNTPDDERLALVESLYKDSIEKFALVFGKDNLLISKMEDACEHINGPVGYFFSIVGIDDALKKIANARLNMSLSEKAFELFSYINALEPLFVDGRLNDHRFRFDLVRFERLQGEKYSFDQKQSYLLDAHSQNDKAWLKQSFGVDYTNQTQKAHENADLIYDERYYEEFRYALEDCNDIILGYVYQFLKNKLKTTAKENGKDIVERLIKDIEKMMLKMQDESKLTFILNGIFKHRSKHVKNAKYKNSVFTFQSVGNDPWVSVDGFSSKSLVMKIDITTERQNYIQVFMGRKSKPFLRSIKSHVL